MAASSSRTRGSSSDPGRRRGMFLARARMEATCLSPGLTGAESWCVNCRRQRRRSGWLPRNCVHTGPDRTGPEALESSVAVGLGPSLVLGLRANYNHDMSRFKPARRGPRPRNRE
ncbi:hypothetical protein PVAP13_1KG456800 [Panicum virgatum]|uniref:Uncharacterized protein n=1 Tax=Panicum virgatum TaxID=38727 RepID=A0A8T0XL43_PANVG|nr:hypothetical protein PVAP13_1KG456800 [Panicum virgatum]